MNSYGECSSFDYCCFFPSSADWYFFFGGGALETVAVLELEKLCCIEVNLHGVPIVKL